jgi:hypothetical protein
MARGSAAPRKALIREYNGDGTVRRELARSASGWVSRPSTLPTEAMARSLASFADPVPSLLTGSSAVVATLVSVDTVENVEITNVDSLWTDAPGLNNIAIRESTADGFSLIGDIYYAGAGDVGNLGLSASGVVVMELPEDDGFVEMVLNPTDWSSAKADVTLLPGFPGWPSQAGALQGSITMGPQGSNILLGDPTCLPGLREKEDPCASFRYSALGYGAMALLAIGGALVSSYAAPPLAPWFTRSAVGSVATGSAYLATYYECKRPKQ